VSLYEKTVYPQLAGTTTNDELPLQFTPTAEETDFAEKGARSPGSRLMLLTLLKVFQKLHRFPGPDEIPPAIGNHVRIHLGFGEAVAFEYGDSFQRTRQHRAIREYTGVGAWSKEARHIAVAAGYQAALVMARPADIMNAIIAGLIHSRYELPAFDTLERITKRVRALAQRKTCGSVFRRLTAKERKALDHMLVIAVDQRRTSFQTIKRLPQRPSRKHLNDSMQHLDWLESLGSQGTALKGVAPSLVDEFAKQARTSDAGELKDFAAPKRYTLLLSLIQNTQGRTRDAVARMLVNRVATIHKRAKEELLQRQQDQRERVDGLLGKFGEVIHIVSTVKSDRRVGQQVRVALTQARDIEVLQQECATARTWTGNNYLPLLWAHYKNNRPVLFRAVNALKLSPATDDDSLLKAWNVLCEERNGRAQWIPKKSVPLGFASQRWRNLLRHPTDATLIDRRQLEICLLSYITDHLQAGNLFAPGSESYADHRAELLPWAECESRLPDFCERTGLPTTADEFVKELQRQLTEVADRVDRQFPQNTAIRMNDKGEPVLPKYSARAIPESAQRLHVEVMRRMPERSILDILVNVHHLTNFTTHFGPASHSEPKIERAAERYLLTIFAIGSNMGPVQAARHLQGLVTAHMLSFANRKHVTVERLEAARRELVDFYLQLDLPRAWGNGTMVGADGTQFDFYENNLLAGHHFRYRKMGAVAYRHVADNYIAVFGNFVPPGVWEGIYVIEALQQARLSIEADTVCSDTQGQSAAVFAFARMFGIRLLPRIRNWKDLKLYRPRARARYQHIDSLFSETVDWRLLRRHWKHWMQLILSVQAGGISSSTLIRQLSHHSELNLLARFAEELGRVERTMFLLEWVSNQLLRQTVTGMTNKVESYHGFSKWLSFGGEVIAENDPDEQQKHIRYNDLLASAVILQNVIDMTKIIEELRREGWTITQEDLSFLCPYITPGLKRFGAYVMDLERDMEPFLQELLLRTRPAAQGTARRRAKEA
jgi:TnpA family transposase